MASTPLRVLAMGALALPQAVLVAVQGPAPLLLREAPLLLLALHPFAPWSLLVATRTDLLPFLAVIVAVRTVPSCGGYLVGRWYGPAALARLRQLRRTGPVALRLQRLSARFGGVLLLVYPGATASVLAGVNGMPVRRFLPLMVGGLTAAALLARGIASAASDRLAALADLVEQSALSIGLVLLAGAVAWSILTRERLRRGTFGPSPDVVTSTESGSGLGAPAAPAPEEDAGEAPPPSATPGSPP